MLSSVEHDKSFINSDPGQRERSGSMLECLTRDRGPRVRLTGVIALCPWARNIYPSLVLVQPRKTHPYITERLLVGRKESNKINLPEYAGVFAEQAASVTSVSLNSMLDPLALSELLHESTRVVLTPLQ